MSKQIKLFTDMKKWTVMAALFTFVCIPLDSYSSNAEAGSVSITRVAKKASPAVVSINAKISPQTKQEAHYNGRNYHFEEPLDPFNDNFFQQFFGSSKNRNSIPRQSEQSIQASGFIISEDGYILTNAHAIQNADKITIQLDDGREFIGKIIGADPDTDIAVVKIDGHDLPFLTLGNSDALEVGQWVVAIGNLLGLQSSVTAGIVSAKGRNNLSLTRIEDFIQTDATINRGNSGGPLLNLNSEIIGMNTAIITNSGSGGYTGIGFAIPSNLIHQVTDELIKTGTVSRGFMGVSLQPVNHDLAQAFGLNKVEGVIISEVFKNSPAERAGIKQGDILLEFNKKKIENVAALRNGVALMKPDSELKLTLVRNGKHLMIPVTLGVNPDYKVPVQQQTENDFGLIFETLTPDVSEELGYNGMEGALITGVKPGSPASWAGLREGTLIVAVNHKVVESAEDLQKEINSIDMKKPILFLVKQGESMQFISLKIGTR